MDENQTFPSTATSPSAGNKPRRGRKPSSQGALPASSSVSLPARRGRHKETATANTNSQSRMLPNAEISEGKRNTENAPVVMKLKLECESANNVELVPHQEASIETDPCPTMNSLTSPEEEKHPLASAAELTGVPPVVNESKASLLNEFQAVSSISAKDSGNHTSSGKHWRKKITKKALFKKAASKNALEERAPSAESFISTIAEVQGEADDKSTTTSIPPSSKQNTRRPLKSKLRDPIFRGLDESSSSLKAYSGRNIVKVRRYDDADFIKPPRTHGKNLKGASKTVKADDRGQKSKGRKISASIKVTDSSDANENITDTIISLSRDESPSLDVSLSFLMTKGKDRATKLTIVISSWKEELLKLKAKREAEERAVLAAKRKAAKRLAKEEAVASKAVKRSEESVQISLKAKRMKKLRSLYKEDSSENTVKDSPG